MSENEYQIRLEKGLVSMILTSWFSVLLSLFMCYTTPTLHNPPLPHYLPDKIIILVFLTLQESSKGRK